MIPPKLIKISSKVLSKPLAIAIIIVLIKEYFRIMLKLREFLPWIKTPMINTP